MTPTEISKLRSERPREFDAAVAERVMGWRSRADYNYWMSFRGDTFDLHKLKNDWKPSTNPTDDYAVLCHVREKWRGERLADFADEVYGLASGRGGFTMASYRVGDYAEAALAIVTQQEAPTP
jgi:hypothetical protein